MAIFHLVVRIVGRGQGRSVVAAAAYRAGEQLHDQRLGRDWNFTCKNDVSHSELLLPPGAPAEFADRETLWNAVEMRELRRRARLARDIELTLPRDLNRDDRIALVRSFALEQFVSRGMIADLAVHEPLDKNGEPQPHAHILLSMRTVSTDGFGLKVREWDHRSALLGWREAWASDLNAALARRDHDLSVDHRSYKACGLDLEPQTKIGRASNWAGHADTDRVEAHRAIARRNGERIADDPMLALRAITYYQSTFTRADLACLLNRHSDGAAQFAALMAKVETCAEMVALGRDGGKVERFTTRDMIALEASLEQSATLLVAQRDHPVGPSIIDPDLSQAQRTGLESVLGPQGLALVVGVAGSGKSSMLGAARVAWQAEGYDVRGAALSAMAAEGLERSAGIPSRTLAALESGWMRGFERLSARSILVVDEAGLVGSRQMAMLLSEAAEAGAKVVLVGDAEQLQAIEAGAAFRVLVERHGAAELTDALRQRQAWQRSATAELARGRTGDALARYTEAGSVRSYPTHDAAARALVDRWAARGGVDGSVMLAATRDDVTRLNDLARERLQRGQPAGDDLSVATPSGERVFAVGDRVMLLRNDATLGFKNGQRGRVAAIEGGRLVLDLAGRRVGLDPVAYPFIDYGYAMTIHKAQGLTAERAYVLAAPAMDRHSTYVGLTRHREGVDLVYGRDNFATPVHLARRLSRERLKDTTLDYAASFAARRGIEAGPERSRFDDLDLAVGGSAADVSPERWPARRELHARAFAQALKQYEVATQATERMATLGLPVLPHQSRALEAARDRLAKLQPEGFERARERRGPPRERAPPDRDRDLDLER